MRRAGTIFSLTIGLCCGVTCSIDVPGDGDGSGIHIGGTTHAALDRADATITIADQVNQSRAIVTARIVDGGGRVVRLRSDQAVRVNGTSLNGPQSDGEYSGVVASAEAYTIEVQEPARGIESTTVSSAGDFEITNPGPGAGASLSGFVLEWSNADVGLEVKIVLRQVVFDSQTRRSYGPFADTGQRELSAEDLRDFVQGAALEIVIAKLTQGAVGGFREGTYEVRLEAARAVDPRP